MKKKFVYLVQGEASLPAALKGLKGKDSDVFFLSWKKPVKNAIFFPVSTWAEGRNRLLKEAAGLDYLYFIFVDDDIVLEKTYFDKSSEKNPWRIFEKFLLDFEPAVGVPDYQWAFWKSARKKIEPVEMFDACVTAIHKDAVHALLPYYDCQDSISWFFSLHYLFHVSSLLYGGSHVLRCNSIKAINEKNRSYPENTDWSTPNNFFYESILSKEFKEKFQPFPNALSSRQARKKSQSYAFSEKELSCLFDFKHPLWERKKEILNGCDLTSAGFANGIRLGLSRLGELLNQKCRAELTSALFCLITPFWEMQKQFGTFGNLIDWKLGKLGIYLKKNHLGLYGFIKKHKK